MTPSEPPPPEDDPRLRDPRENPVVRTILDLDASRIKYEAALAVATGRELAAARRLIRLELGAETSHLDQVCQRMAELERRFPGIEDAAY